MNNDLLPDFQKFITERKLAAENQIPFYAYWVSRFLRFSGQEAPLFDARTLMSRESDF
jgi:hypothetical protein